MIDFFQHLLHEFKLPLQNPVLVFSLILSIILLSPVVLRKLKIPGIIGLILAGVLIGPHATHILENNSAIELFSTIGLLYIMFIAGLELDLNEFMANRNKSVLFGLFTFSIPLGIGFPVCYYILGYGFNTSLLTASMFATHTLVAYPIVSKLGVSKNQAVAVTVGGTILTDTAVLIMLAVIIRNSQGSLDTEFWIKLGISLVIFSAIMFFLIPMIARWFFRKLESEKHSHYIFVLSVVFFGAFLAEVAGIEPIIGAFVAGLALNKLIPHSSALMNRIEFIGNSLFIPFFLISVGMIVDVRVIMSGMNALIVAGTLSIVAIFGKWFAALITQFAFRYSKAQRQLVFGLSSAHAAATLAVILVGYNAGILDENILNGTIILILITCIIASFATERAAKKIIIETEEGAPAQAALTSVRSEHILLPVANIKNFDKLLELAIYIKDKKSDNPVSILSVVSNDHEAELNIMKTRNKLEEFVRQASASETQVNIITTIDHNPASGISRISKEIMADIIVLGWPQRPGVIEKLIGRKIDSIIETTEKTTFICQLARPLALLKRIVITAPPLAEYENGFRFWFLKMTQLAQELSIPVYVYCDSGTTAAINKTVKQAKVTANVKTVLFNDWEEYLILARDLEDEDLLVLASARRGATSYLNVLENLPLKLEKYFPNNCKFVIYPHQYDATILETQYGDFSPEPLSRGLEAVQKIGKSIGSIFKKDSTPPPDTK